MEEINLMELLKYYLKKVPLIILLTFFAVLIGIFYMQIIQVPLYHGTTTIILVQKNQGTVNSTITQNQINVNEKLVTTYSNLIKSRRVLEQVISSLKLETTANALSNQITVTSVSETPIIKITVSDPSKDQAVLIANNLASVFSKEIVKIYDLKNVSIIDKAIVEEKPYNVNLKKQVFIYFLLGLVLSMGIVFVMFYFDNTIKNKKEIETKLNMPVLGEIPLVKKSMMVKKSKPSLKKVSETVSKIEEVPEKTEKVKEEKVEEKKVKEEDKEKKVKVEKTSKKTTKTKETKGKGKKK